MAKTEKRYIDIKVTSNIDGVTKKASKNADGLGKGLKGVAAGAVAATTGIRSMTAALVSSGIGAIAVALGSVVSFFGKTLNVSMDFAAELSRLKDLVMKYNLINQVDFLESFSSTDEVYNYSKIHVMPTITTPDSIEGFGISNIEAASKGLPCIVSNSGGTPESIQDNGFIISENNVEELIDAILKVMKNLPKLSKKSLNFAKKFRDSSKIQEYLNCI